jgi:putative ABC transport system ATP-binding protein
MTSGQGGLALDVEGLTFSYRRGAPVLDIPSFRMERGRRVFLHGPSGSGKTTLLGVLAGILDAGSGRVTVLGRDFAQLKGQERDHFRGANLGYIFQMFNLIPYLNVRRNILLPCWLSPERRARLGSTPLDQAAAELARRLDIEGLLDKPVVELSVGQQQRVAAARALIGAPALIIADEPTSALDTDHREAFLRLLFDEAGRAGASILFVSHDHSLTRLFEQVISLNEINKAARVAASQ